MADQYGEDILTVPVLEYDNDKNPVLDENGKQKKVWCVFEDKEAADKFIQQKQPPIRKAPLREHTYLARHPVGLERDFYIQLVEEQRSALRCYSSRGRGG